MKPRPIGIVAGGGGPIGAAFILQAIIAECQKKYGSWRSYEFPCINFYSYPYSEMLLADHTSGIPSRELGHSIQQLKLVGMEIIVVPCFTMSSYLTYRNYGIELIEMGAIMRDYLKKNKIKNPLVICSERTRKSGYCNKYFECHYPEQHLQDEVGALLEKALKGEMIDLQPLLNCLPEEPIVCAATVLSAKAKPIEDPRWVNANEALAEHVVYRSFEGSLGDGVVADSIEEKEEALIAH